MLYAGMNSSEASVKAGKGSTGVWKYDGTTWTNTGGHVSSYAAWPLACGSSQNVLHAGTNGHGVWSL